MASDLRGGEQAEQLSQIAIDGDELLRIFFEECLRVIAALPDWLKDYQVVHLSGQLDWPEVEQARAALPAGQMARYHAFPFLHEMGPALAAADLVVSRAGASALGEYPLFGLPAILVQITKQPGANVIQVVDHIREQLPDLKAALPVSIDQGILFDTTTSIRNAVHDVEVSLILSTILVILVVFLFLRNFKATLVPTVCVPLSLLGTFGVMYLLGFSLDNF